MSLKELLIKIGLNAYEAQAYLTLLHYTGLAAKELSKVSGIPQPRVYDTMASLERKGFAYSQPGKGTRFFAVEPGQALSRHLEKIELKVKEQRELINVLSKKLRPIYEKGQRNRIPFDFIWVIKDPKHIASEVIKRAKKAKSEIVSFVMPPFVFSKEHFEANFDELRRGVKLRDLYLYNKSALTQLPVNFAFFERFINEGGEIRFHPSLLTKLLIFDEAEVWVALEDPSGQPGVTALVIRHPTMSKFLKTYFEILWKEAKTFDQVKNELKSLLK